MSNRLIGAGNLGDAPSLKHVRIGEETRPVLEMSIYLDRTVPVDDGGFEDRGGFWLRADLWGARAEHVAPLLAKGARVRVEGNLEQEAWEDKESGELRTAFKLNLDWLAIDPVRVKEIGYLESSRSRSTDADEEDE